jgi:hypothetical protein
LWQEFCLPLCFILPQKIKGGIMGTEEKNKEIKNKELVDTIVKTFDGEIVVEGEPIEYRGLLYDREILNKNLTIYSVKYKGERMVNKNKVYDYIVKAEIHNDDNVEKVEFVTNHSYIIRIANLLQEFKRPLNCRIEKDKNRYVIRSWK